MPRVPTTYAIGSALVLIIALAAASCANASGEITGGDGRFDASSSVPYVPGDAGPLSPGHSWQALYADYFGNPARAACAGNGSCHGASSQPGSQSSAFVCPENDKDSCYTSITSGTAQLVVAGNPGNSALLTQVLRHADGSSGNMPKSPPYPFSDEDLKRISDWITDGANNDLEPPPGEDAGDDSGTVDEGGITDSGSD